MSKDFETEYREYQNQNVPDLWSRIEAAIDAEEAEKKSETKKVIPFPFWKMATVAAACFAVIICIPSLGIMMLGFGGSKSAENCTTADTSAELVMEECTSEEELDCVEETVADCVTESAAEVTEDFNSMFDAESETNLDDGYSEALSGATEEATPEAEETKERLNIRVSRVEESGEELRYTAIRLDTQEEVIVIQEADKPRMAEGETYLLYAIKNGDVYYFDAFVVE